MADPKPVRPRVKDAKAYERALRKSFLDPFIVDLQRRLAQAESVNQAYQALRAGVAALQAQPRSGVPIDLIIESLNRIQGYNKDKLFRAFRRALGVDVRPLLQDAIVRPFMLERIKDNVELIKTIPPRAHVSLQRRIEQEFAEAPFDQSRIRRMVRDEYKSSGYNLRRIVRDQSSKLNGQLTQIRQRQLGVESFIWFDAGDERVRAEHRARNGITFEWSDPPDGEIPGGPVQCRCYGQAVITPQNRDRLKSSGRPA